jgi:hypothetical protein
MNKNEYNLNKLFKHINKRTIGLRFHGGRHDIMNKFGILFDLINKENNEWTQSISAETGRRLIKTYIKNILSV